MEDRTFEDSNNRRWKIRVDVNTMRRVDEMTGVDLMKIADNRTDETNLVFRLMSNPVMLVDVLYAALKPALDRANVTPEEFGESLFGDAILEAHEALMQAIIDFFPSQKQKALRAVLAKIHALERRMENKALEVIEGGPMDQLIEQEWERMEREFSVHLNKPGNLSGSSPASAASETPAP